MLGVLAVHIPGRVVVTHHKHTRTFGSNANSQLLGALPHDLCEMAHVGEIASRIGCPECVILHFTIPRVNGVFSFYVGSSEASVQIFTILIRRTMLQFVFCG